MSLLRNTPHLGCNTDYQQQQHPNTTPTKKWSTAMLSLFLQATVEDIHHQFLVVPPHGSDTTRVFRRAVPMGVRRGPRWAEIPLDTLGFHAPDSPLDKSPVAVPVTDADWAQMAGGRIPTTLTLKAQAAFDRTPAYVPSPDVEPMSLALIAESAHDLVVEQVGLTRYVRDGRRRVALRVEPVRPQPDTSTPVAVTQTSGAPAIQMAVVPPAELAQSYVHRKVYGVDDFEVFDAALAEGENVLIKGPTGAAKTMSARAFAASRGLRCFTISGSVNFEPTQAFGKIMLDSTGSTFWQDGGATECVRNGNAVLILDEINFIPPKVITPLYPLLDDRRSITLLDNKGETIVAAPNLLIVATMNPGYLGTQPLSPATANRFRYTLNWEYDEAVEKTLIPFPALRSLAAQLRQAEAAQTITTPTPTNALMDIISTTKTLGLDFALANFVARFDDREHAAVRLALDAWRDTIAQDLGVAESVDSPTDSETVDQIIAGGTP